MATAARHAEAQDVRAMLGYAGRFEGRARLDSENPANSNFSLEPHEMLIRDARAMPGVHSLAKNGFEFVRHGSHVAGDPEFFEQANTQQVRPSGVLSRYADEMIEFLRDYVGAKAMVPQVGSFIARASARSAKRTWASTADMVHLDYTPEGADLFLKWNIETSGEAPPSHKAFAFIQTWRAVSPGPQDNCLAICDGASVPPEDGIVIDAVLGPADVPGRCFPFRICRHRADHQWYYLADMEPDDLLIFKGFDSREPTSMNAMHSAFTNPLAGPDAQPRQSVEARFIAFFD